MLLLLKLLISLRFCECSFHQGYLCRRFTSRKSSLGYLSFVHSLIQAVATRQRADTPASKVRCKGRFSRFNCFDFEKSYIYGQVNANVNPGVPQMLDEDDGQNASTSASGLLAHPLTPWGCVAFGAHAATPAKLPTVDTNFSA